jgi:hypothetical protein
MRLSGIEDNEVFQGIINPHIYKVIINGSPAKHPRETIHAQSARVWGDHVSRDVNLRQHPMYLSSVQ